jgi:hypothetical protein
MTTYEAVEEKLYAFYNLALDKSEWPSSGLGRLASEENPPVAIGLRMGGPQSRSELWEKKKNP